VTPAREARSGSSLRERIAFQERQLLMHRQSAMDQVAGLRCRMHDAMTGPMALLAAAGLGVLLEQATRRRGDSVLTMINALSGGRALLMALLPLLAGTAHPDPDRGADAS